VAAGSLDVAAGSLDVAAGSLDVAAGQVGVSDLDDTRALGGLLYAALTGRWPLPGWHGLPAPRHGGSSHPRDQRRGIARELDEITATALSGGYADPDALFRALARVPQSTGVPDTDDRDRPRHDRLRRVAWWVLPPVLVAGAGLTSWIVGRDLGRVPGEDRTAPTLIQPHARSNAKSGTRPVWTKPPTVTSFDPDGDGEEDPGGVGLAVDSDPTTAWTTDIYHGNAHFGGLKPGVGLLIDLGRPKKVDAARLLLSASGAAIELRAGDVDPKQASNLPVVAHDAHTPASTKLALATPTTARYWLLWITSLPPSGDNDYSLGVAEISLLH
jgi:hypothetical protein